MKNMVNAPYSIRPRKTWRAYYALFCLFAALYFNASSNAVRANNAAPSSFEPSVSEYQVKALYLYYFAKFVDWPASAFSAKTSPIIIGIIGDNSFINLVEEVTKKKTIQERPVVIHHLKWSENIRSCHMLFVDIYERKGLAQFHDALQSSPILIVTEMEDAYPDKGIMNLFVENGKVQFEIDLAAAEKAQLRISSKLLRMAKVTAGRSSGKKE
jgi:hypothetical protein